MSWEAAITEAKNLLELKSKDKANKDFYNDKIVKLALANCEIKHGGNRYDGKQKPTLSEFTRQVGVSYSTLDKWIRKKK